MAESYLGGHSVIRLRKPKGEKRKDAAKAYWTRVKQGRGPVYAPKEIDLADATMQTKIRRRNRKKIKVTRAKSAPVGPNERPPWE
jgi:hypothetical protein